MRTKRALSRLTTGMLSEDGAAEVARIDYFIDSTLADLDEEEPTLRAFLDGPIVQGIKRSHGSALAALIKRDQTNGVPFPRIISRMVALNQQAVEAVALAAVRNDRSSR